MPWFSPKTMSTCPKCGTEVACAFTCGVGVSANRTGSAEEKIKLNLWILSFILNLTSEFYVPSFM
jgi:hypothetical protein